ncbi:CinA family protein [Hydromonas duriensis]|uniref:Nicotinamide-nucleotide amidase n=1 Tax=Hydromonas duriensis TaxID=1527608 RepID=A0A4V3DJZ0_9BURK|nr:CinA family protein [Hydromonas duriensis]TDR31965.1 nicotinamide-nucleotide amidase [Hydromonas duriensis]
MSLNLTSDMIARVMTLADRLNQQGWHMGTAESCTGGGIAHTLTELAGASSWFTGGIVAYSNALKQDVLNVRTEDLLQHGAVSEVVVGQMASGALRVLGVNCAVAVSGIAGPGGGTAEKPVGTVCLAWGWRDGVGTTFVRTVTRRFEGDRAAIRQQAIATVLDGLIRVCEFNKLNLPVPMQVLEA